MTTPTSSTRLTPGGLVFRLNAPAFGLNVGVVEGASEADMQAGAGHVASTPLPNEMGNVVVVGYTRFYGRPFQRLANAKPGEVVAVQMLDGGSFRYRVVPAFQDHSNPWTAMDLTPTVVGQAGALGRGRWLTLVTDPHENSRVTVLRLVLIG